MRLVLGSAILLLCACPPPSGDGCLPRPGFGFPTSITPGGTSDTVVTTARRITLAAPSVTCIPNDPTLVTVSATLSGGGQTPRRVPATITLSTREESQVEVDLSTVPPGVLAAAVRRADDRRHHHRGAHRDRSHQATSAAPRAVVFRQPRSNVVGHLDLLRTNRRVRGTASRRRKRHLHGNQRHPRQERALGREAQWAWNEPRSVRRAHRRPVRAHPRDPAR